MIRIGGCNSNQADRERSMPFCHSEEISNRKLICVRFNNHMNRIVPLIANRNVKGKIDYIGKSEQRSWQAD